MADPVSEFLITLFWLVLIVGGGILIIWGILIYLLGGLARFFESLAKNERALKTSVIGGNRSEVIAKLKFFNRRINPPKVRTILRELTEHPEQHYEEIDFLVENQLSFVEMLDLIDRISWRLGMKRKI